MKIELKGEWLELNVDAMGVAFIISTLKHEEPVADDDSYWNIGIDAIESLILGHFCAGVDVFSPEYREGIQTALDALSNNIYG